MTEIRVEADGLGAVELPADALYGVNTWRALQNFPLSGRPISSYPDFVWALATVKQAAGKANADIGVLSADRAAAIVAACEELKKGKHDRHLLVDMLEGSGGTSTNMNVNEVIANVVASRRGDALGAYVFVHPNDHVNLGQSTNDVIPTAMKLAVHRALAGMLSSIDKLAAALSEKERAYASVLRLGRTCLQDAQPMTLGQAIGGYAAVTRRHVEQLGILRNQFLHLPLGGTAIGTGFGSSPGYRNAAMQHLRTMTGEEFIAVANAFDGMQNMDTCARLSAELRNTANSLWKIANDLVVLSSGPAGGIQEVVLPSVQQGSSIMPGKVNPVIPMAVCQVAFAITGNDAAIAMACQQGLLEINHYELLVCDRLLDSIELLSRAADMFASRCIDGLVANEASSFDHLLASSALATALVPDLGYAIVSGIVRDAIAQKRTFVDVATERGLLGEGEIVSVLAKAADCRV
ncbi:aspartate ammonia-lyase [Rhizobiales bacterium RZME27]|uniref:Aspartate ammonia-lyase n=1 Tax=Endobacterium cereale TaxID=2663029 RepID=A0A6A8A5N5_9HYPH|nr:aspartate ammonia-lyase [Endobacterium cereale]MEB2846321.1 aspartate ammonia-lyase [Endobacterium cereale]MQY46383.1 aspartate ammonia-lyase [Endobacterium cereale]